MRLPDEKERNAMVLANPVRTVMLDGELPGGYVLRTPLPIRVWREGDEYVADSDELNLHSFGPDEETALTNFRAEIVDHLASLDSMGNGLAPGLVADQARLRARLVPMTFLVGAHGVRPRGQHGDPVGHPHRQPL